jgi:hypothetical protein
MSYEIDFWGRIRRTVASARREAEATAADLETARLSLQAELAMDYFELRAADAQQQLLDETVRAFEAALRLTTNRFEGGAAPKSDVAQAQTQLDTTRAQAIDVAVQRAQFEHAIATLIGKPPAAFNLPPRPLSTLPPDVPAGLPSELLERRPDIAAAAAAARGGVRAALAAALHEPLPGRGRQLPASHHRSDRDPHQPANRDRYPQAAHGCQRVAGEGRRRRLGRGRAVEVREISPRAFRPKNPSHDLQHRET